MIIREHKRGLGFLFLIFSFFSNLVIAQSFLDVTATAGISIPHDGTPAHDLVMHVGSGAAWIDYDNDGDLDLYYTMRQGSNYLYKNNGNGTFTDVASTLGVQDSSGDGAGVSVADFNNDGWDDLFLSNNIGCKLFKNNFGSSFSEITSTAGVSITGNSRSTSASWGDYDKDGYLDLYITHHLPVDYTLANTDTQDYLFHNNGNETFTNVSSVLYPVAQLKGAGFIAGWTDYDNDDDLDIILINDCPVGPTPQGTLIFRNDGGSNPTSWDFTEVSASVLTDCRNGMGIGIGDYNRDGWQDIAYTNIAEVALFQNVGGSFINKTTEANVGGQTFLKFSWAANFFDYDLDGWLDLFFALGSLNNPSSTDPHPNYLFSNNGDGTFTNTSTSQNMDDSDRSRNAIVGDYDNDGDEDMFIVNYGAMPLLKMNNNSGNNYLKVKLVGTSSNKNGIGSKLKLTLGNGTVQYYETHGSQGYGGSNTPYVHFGLGTETSLTNLEVKWLSGLTEVFSSISTNNTFTLTEGTGSAVLPLDLLSFDASKNHQDGVDLKWQTASEENTKEFIIERSPNGQGFQKIGRVPAVEFSSQLLDYLYEDAFPKQGMNYYRLRMIDIDGSFKYSGTQSIDFNSEKSQIILSPNPLKDGQQLEVSISKIIQGGFYVNLLDIQGKEVFAAFYDYQENNKIAIDLNQNGQMSEGIYFLNIIGLNGFSYSDKLIILD